MYTDSGLRFPCGACQQAEEAGAARRGQGEMADVFTPEKRSEIMSRIRSSGTTPESRLCAAVREALGRRWRIDMNVRTLRGQPDVVVPGLRLAIFADGCFYHGCPEHGHVPKSNVGYWLPKLVRNRRRDRASRRALRRMSFAVWRLWEHELRGRRMARTQLVLARRLKARLDIHRSRKEATYAEVPARRLRQG